jgi:hypothetical protein
MPFDKFRGYDLEDILTELNDGRQVGAAAEHCGGQLHGPRAHAYLGRDQLGDLALGAVGRSGAGLLPIPDAEVGSSTKSRRWAGRSAGETPVSTTTSYGTVLRSCRWLVKA